MRKLGFILAALICCLFTATGGGEAPASPAAPTAILTFSHAAADQWRCERAYNSDLNLSRAFQEVTPVQVPPVTFRGGAANADRPSLRFGACDCAGSLKATSIFNFPIPLSGGRAADYYVYRLRRLII